METPASSSSIDDRKIKGMMYDVGIWSPDSFIFAKKKFFKGEMDCLDVNSCLIVDLKGLNLDVFL